MLFIFLSRFGMHSVCSQWVVFITFLGFRTCILQCLSFEIASYLTCPPLFGFGIWIGNLLFSNMKKARVLYVFSHTLLSLEVWNANSEKWRELWNRRRLWIFSDVWRKLELFRVAFLYYYTHFTVEKFSVRVGASKFSLYVTKYYAFYISLKIVYKLLTINYEFYKCPFFTNQNFKNSHPAKKAQYFTLNNQFR